MENNIFLFMCFGGINSRNVDCVFFPFDMPHVAQGSCLYSGKMHGNRGFLINSVLVSFFFLNKNRLCSKTCGIDNITKLINN